MSANQKRTTRNPCGRQVLPHQAYEVWQSPDGTWTYWVLKKYSVKENEFSRYYCAVMSPFTFGRLQYGDMYASSVKDGNRKLTYNPLVQDDPDPKGAA